MNRWRTAQPPSMEAGPINELMERAIRSAPGDGAVMLMAVGAARLAERLKIPLCELLALVALSYKVSGKLPPPEATVST